jgi:hypothetical protein
MRRMAIVMYSFDPPVPAEDVKSFDINTLPFSKITYEQEHIPAWETRDITPGNRKDRQYILQTLTKLDNDDDTYAEIQIKRCAHSFRGREREGRGQESERLLPTIIVDAQHSIYILSFLRDYREGDGVCIHRVICYIPQEDVKTKVTEDFAAELFEPVGVKSL